jgi:hypothetical protein
MRKGSLSELHVRKLKGLHHRLWLADSVHQPRYHGLPKVCIGPLVVDADPGSFSTALDGEKGLLLLKNLLVRSIGVDGESGDALLLEGTGQHIGCAGVEITQHLTGIKIGGRATGVESTGSGAMQREDAGDGVAASACARGEVRFVGGYDGDGDEQAGEVAILCLGGDPLQEPQTV